MLDLSYWPQRLSFVSLAAEGMCTDFTFYCADGQCVNKLNAECDKVSDCTDGSDEEGCGESLSITESLLAQVSPFNDCPALIYTLTSGRDR